MGIDEVGIDKVEIDEVGRYRHRVQLFAFMHCGCVTHSPVVDGSEVAFFFTMH